MYLTEGLINRQEQLAQDIFLLEVLAPQVVGNARPGQFVHLGLSTTYDPLLRRPMSIFNVDGDVFKILYQVVGRGTRLMSQFTRGDVIDILGPLGRCFQTHEGKQILIGGGLGAAPLIFLTRKLWQQGYHVHLLVGMKDNELAFLQDEVPEGCDMCFSRESALESPRMVTELLPSFLEMEERVSIYCCGPQAMYREISRICEGLENIKAQVAVDRHMGCGVGTCLSCIVPVRRGKRREQVYVRACVEGPVFDLEEVVLDES